MAPAPCSSARLSRVGHAFGLPRAEIACASKPAALASFAPRSQISRARALSLGVELLGSLAHRAGEAVHLLVKQQCGERLPDVRDESTAGGQQRARTADRRSGLVVAVVADQDRWPRVVVHRSEPTELLARRFGARPRASSVVCRKHARAAVWGADKLAVTCRTQVSTGPLATAEPGSATES